MYFLLTTEQLRKWNQDAVENDRNRSLTEIFWANVDPNGLHLVTWSMIHNDVEMRSIVLTKQVGTDEALEITIDVSFDTWRNVRTPIIQSIDDAIR
jgi:hypothetical protein